MNSTHDPSNDCRHPPDVSPKPTHGANNVARFAYWALAVLVALCLALVTWFWTVMLCPSRSANHYDNEIRSPESLHTHFDARARSPEKGQDRPRVEHDGLDADFSSYNE